MKGHIRERSPGHWAIVLDHIDAQGKRRRKWHSFIGGKREAQIECARLIAQRRDGGEVDPSRETVTQYLDRWLEHMRTQVSPRTHERYAELCRKSIAPLIGGESLTTLDADGTIDLIEAARGTNLFVLILLCVLCGLRNPADAVKPPKVERREMKTPRRGSCAAMA